MRVQLVAVSEKQPCAPKRHHLHRQRLRPHLHQQRRQHRPRLGFAPPGDGRAVYGGDLYGKFPVLGLKNANNGNFDSSDDQLTNGAMLPAASVDQLGATLGRWFGLSDVQIADIFPNLANWDLAKRDLGFFTPPA